MVAVAFASLALATYQDDVDKAVGKHYTAMKTLGQDRDIELAKCKKEGTAAKRKACRVTAVADYKAGVAKADAAKTKALADADAGATKANAEAAAKVEADKKDAQYKVDMARCDTVAEGPARDTCRKDAKAKAGQ